MKIEIKKIRDYVWEIPRTGEMLVPGIVYGDAESIVPLKEEINRLRGFGQWYA